MALIPIITRRDVHEYIIVNNVSGSLQVKKNSALKLVLNTFNFDEYNVKFQKAVVDIKKCLAVQMFNR